MSKLKGRYLVIIVLILIATSPITYTFSKYVTKKLGEYILDANHFYFNSDKLKQDGASYTINNWSGVADFNIQFELNNKKNNLVTANSDITYEITVSCDSDITCNLDQAASGTLYSTTSKKDFVLTIHPSKTFVEGESAHIKLIANSTSPYKKTLTADFTINVGKKGISYEIVDTANNPTFTFNITNARESYTIKTAFSTYAVGDEISSEDYLKLSDDDKKKCLSYQVNLTFDPTKVLIDSTSEIGITSAKTYTSVNGVSYVSGLTFDVEALSSISIRFYKVDASANYTYPITNDTSIVTFNAQY